MERSHRLHRAEARSCEGRSREARPKKFPPGSSIPKRVGRTRLRPHTTGALISLADYYLSQERYAEAEPLLLRALAVHEAAYESDPPRVAMDLAKLGVLYLSQDQYSEAQPYYERALVIEDQNLQLVEAGAKPVDGPLP